MFNLNKANWSNVFNQYFYSETLLPNFEKRLQIGNFVRIWLLGYFAAWGEARSGGSAERGPRLLNHLTNFKPFDFFFANPKPSDKF